MTDFAKNVRLRKERKAARVRQWNDAFDAVKSEDCDNCPISVPLCGEILDAISGRIDLRTHGCASIWAAYFIDQRMKPTEPQDRCNECNTELVYVLHGASHGPEGPELNDDLFCPLCELNGTKKLMAAIVEERNQLSEAHMEQLGINKQDIAETMLPPEQDCR